MRTGRCGSFRVGITPAFVVLVNTAVSLTPSLPLPLLSPSALTNDPPQGSHLEGEVEHTPGKGEWANGEWANSVDESRAVDIVCPAGTVVLFNALLLHAAHKNTSKDRTRFSVFGHFVPKGLSFAWGGIDFSADVYKDRYPAVKAGL